MAATHARYAHSPQTVIIKAPFATVSLAQNTQIPLPQQEASIDEVLKAYFLHNLVSCWTPLYVSAFFSLKKHIIRTGVPFFFWKTEENVATRIVRRVRHESDHQS